MPEEFEVLINDGEEFIITDVILNYTIDLSNIVDNNNNLNNENLPGNLKKRLKENL